MTSPERLEDELAATHRQLRALTDEVARNDEKMRRTQRRELRLLQAETLDVLITALTDGLRVSYGVEYVSLVLSDADHDVRHMLLANGTPAEDFRALILVESMSGLAPQYIALREPWLGPYAACDHQLIAPGAEDARSIAMIPLTHRGKLLGSINICSSDPSRFTREHATDFLAHLGTIASYCIENTINRARLLRSGFTDVLTGWNNRRYLSVRLGEELARARRDQTSLVCLMLDIDHFKRINDTWGHAAGDVVLKELAERIESQVRASDVAARYGGEEFVVLLENTSHHTAQQIAERIRTRIGSEPIRIAGKSLDLTVSQGLAVRREGDNAHSLLHRADQAMYKAKANGRNCVAEEEGHAGWR